MILRRKILTLNRHKGVKKKRSHKPSWSCRSWSLKGDFPYHIFWWTKYSKNSHLQPVGVWYKWINTEEKGLWQGFTKLSSYYTQMASFFLGRKRYNWFSFLQTEVSLGDIRTKYILLKPTLHGQAFWCKK